MSMTEPQVWVDEKKSAKPVGIVESITSAHTRLTRALTDSLTNHQESVRESYESAVEEMDAESDLRAKTIEQAEIEFRRCKQEPHLANWACKWGLKLCKLAKGE